MASNPFSDSLPVTPLMVLQARKRLTGFSLHTPTEPSINCSNLVGAPISIKWESLQRTGVFKIRGAYNKIASIPHENALNGVVTASTGNHALAVAYAAQQRSIPATVVVPEGASPLKVGKCRRYGAEIISFGTNYDEAAQHSLEVSKKKNATLIHAYADPLVIAGQGTVGLEIMMDQPDADIILVPIGGGGLISGISLWVKSMNPQARVIGVQTTATRAFYENYKAHRLFHVPIEPTIADGLAGNTAQLNLDIASSFVDDVILVDEAGLPEAIRWTLINEQRVLEPSGVVGIAALLQKQLTISPSDRVVVVASGRNIDPQLLQSILTQK
jgi:threonine dehydratase